MAPRPTTKGAFRSIKAARVYAATPSPLGKHLVKVWNSDAYGSTPDIIGYRTKWDHPDRIDVVDEKLCDDTIEYLAPSLEPYKGCTIIDINPGACLWSTKLHDLLKPKRHILIEPEAPYVKPYIQPLLERPGSTYRHLPMYGVHPRSYWDTYSHLFSDGKLIEPREPLASDDPRRTQPDHSILVTGNISRRRFPGVRTLSVQFEDLVLQQMASAGLTNHLFHLHGRVRMLWWTPSWIRNGLFPSRVGPTGSMNMILRSAADVTEIVAAPPAEKVETLAGSGHGLTRRTTPALLRRELDFVEERMQNSGTKIPSGREPVIHGIVTPSSTEDAKVNAVSIFQVRHHTVAQLQTAIEEWQERCRLLYGNLKSRKKLVAMQSGERNIHPQAEQLVSVYSDAYYFQPNEHQIIELGIYVDLCLTEINLEMHVWRLEQTSSSLSQSERDLLAKQRDTLISSARELHSPVRNFRVADYIVDDQVSFWMNPQNSAHLQRRCHPLLSKADDYFPATMPLMLLDMTPTTRDLRMEGITDNLQVVAATSQHLIRSLFQSGAADIATALDRIAPNAAKDLIPNIPDLAIPEKGGRLDPYSVKVRALTPAMIDQLVRAWFEWPFKLHHSELALSGASGATAEQLHGGPEEEYDDGGGSNMDD